MNKQFKLKKCEECNGTGETMFEKHLYDCPDCLGTGWEEPAKRIRNLEMELAAVTKERDELQRLYHKVIQEVLQCNPIPANKRDDDNLEPPWEVIRRVRQQRDTLAEALRDIETFNHSDGQCDSGFTPKYVAFTALDTLKPSITDV